jgi:hypothetical protein
MASTLSSPVALFHKKITRRRVIKKHNQFSCASLRLSSLVCVVVKEASCVINIKEYNKKNFFIPLYFAVFVVKKTVDGEMIIILQFVNFRDYFQIKYKSLFTTKLHCFYKYFFV